MQRTGTWGVPLLRSSIPPNKPILRLRISFHVKDTVTPNTYELQGRACADGSKMTQYLDFHESYSLVGSLNSICFLLALSATLHLALHFLDISNVFQNSIIFDPNEGVDPAKLAIQCL